MTVYGCYIRTYDGIWLFLKNNIFVLFHLSVVAVDSVSVAFRGKNKNHVALNA